MESPGARVRPFRPRCRSKLFFWQTCVVLGRRVSGRGESTEVCGGSRGRVSRSSAFTPLDFSWRSISFSRILSSRISIESDLVSFSPYSSLTLGCAGGSSLPLAFFLNMAGLLRAPRTPRPPTAPCCGRLDGLRMKTCFRMYNGLMDNTWIPFPFPFSMRAPWKMVPGNGPANRGACGGNAYKFKSSRVQECPISTGPMARAGLMW